jgi:Zn-dependent M16 (insulinase) family peptidase
VDNNPVVVRAKPSAALQSTLETTEKDRVAARLEKLGPSGLEQVKKTLQEAKADNEKPIPDAILTGFPVPHVESISWIPVQTAKTLPGRSTVPVVGQGSTAGSNQELEQHLAKDAVELPFFVQYDHVKVSSIPHSCSARFFILIFHSFTFTVRLCDRALECLYFHSTYTPETVSSFCVSSVIQIF